MCPSSCRYAILHHLAPPNLCSDHSRKHGVDRSLMRVRSHIRFALSIEIRVIFRSKYSPRLGFHKFAPRKWGAPCTPQLRREGRPPIVCDALATSKSCTSIKVSRACIKDVPELFRQECAELLQPLSRAGGESNPRPRDYEMRENCALGCFSSMR